MLDGFFQDLRFGARMLAKAPAFTMVAVLTLALGIGVNTAIFSIVNALLLRTLPVQAPERLAVIGDPSRVHSWSNGSPRSDIFSVPLYKEFDANNQVFTSLAATTNFNPRVTLDDSGRDQAAERAHARIVSGNYFETLGVRAAAGRTFTADDDKAPGSDPYLVISYSYWIRRFHRDLATIGKTIHVNGYPLTIIGVAAPGFDGEVVGDLQDFWVPLMMEPQVMPGRDYLNKIDTSTLLLVGRLKPGISLAQARASMNVTFQQIAHSSFADRFDKDNKPELQGLKIDVASAARGLSSIRKELQRPLWFLMGIVGLVLLIACVNVANLLLARSSARQTEIAVRLAIGASAGSVARQLLTECVLLAGLGGALGLLISLWATRALVWMVTGSWNVKMNVSPDGRVLAFTAGASFLTGILFGLAPALRARKMQLFSVLKEGGRSAAASGSPRPSASRYLVAAQVALSVLVLFTSAILVRSLKNLHAFNTGYVRDHLLLIGVDGTAAGYKAERWQNALDELLERFRHLPGATAATYSSNGLFSGSESADGIIVEGYTAARDGDKVAWDDTVGPNYFRTIGVPMVLGREIGPQDTASSPRVVVINQTMAQFYFKDQNPIGRHIAIDDEKLRNQPFEIVGVARDVHDHGIRAEVHRRFYMAGPQSFDGGVGAPNFILRTSGSPSALLESARKAVHEFDPNLAVTDANTANELVDTSLMDQIAVADLSGLFAALALLLACIGLYGLMSYSVAGRTREIGVRMALGATRGKLVSLVLREAMTMVIVGVALGIPIAIAASRGLRSMLFEVTPLDPLSLAATAVLLIAVATLAAFIPARRATRVDPMVALRYE
ncbi:MAG: ABC transporter permease [Terriglobales bacterium]